MSDQPSGQPLALRSWHAVVASGDLGVLAELLSEDVVFRSPAVFAPQQGKDLTLFYLAGAIFNMLTWWLDNEMPYTPEQMDALFQQLVRPGVEATLQIVVH